MSNRSKANLGKHFEQRIMNANRSYLLQGQAVIEKMEVANKFVGGKMIYTDKGPPDFMGAMKGGQAIVFDAKSTKGQSFPLANITRRRHQLTFLERMAKLGALAFYLIEFADHGRYFVLSIPEALAAIELAESGGRKSIPIDMLPLEVKGTFDNVLDYLAVMEKVATHTQTTK